MTKRSSGVATVHDQLAAGHVAVLARAVLASHMSRIGWSSLRLWLPVRRHATRSVIGGAPGLGLEAAATIAQQDRDVVGVAVRGRQLGPPIRVQVASRKGRGSTACAEAWWCIERAAAPAAQERDRVRHRVRHSEIRRVVTVQVTNRNRVWGPRRPRDGIGPRTRRRPCRVGRRHCSRRRSRLSGRARCYRSGHRSRPILGPRRRRTGPAARSCRRRCPAEPRRHWSRRTRATRRGLLPPPDRRRLKIPCALAASQSSEISDTALLPHVAGRPIPDAADRLIPRCG
jgi:hypothetical protein